MDLARPPGRPVPHRPAPHRPAPHRPAPHRPAPHRPALHWIAIALLGLVVLLVPAPALALGESPISDVPAGLAEEPTLAVTVAGPPLTEPPAGQDPAAPGPTVDAALTVGAGGAADTAEGVAPDAPSAPAAPPTTVGSVRPGTPPDCFPSKEEYLDAWHETGEAPDPVFCPPS